MPQKIHANIEDDLFKWAETISASMGYSMNQYINYLIRQHVASLDATEREFLQNFRRKMLKEAEQAEYADAAPPAPRRKRRSA